METAKFISARGGDRQRSVVVPAAVICLPVPVKTGKQGLVISCHSFFPVLILHHVRPVTSAAGYEHKKKPAFSCRFCLRKTVFENHS